MFPYLQLSAGRWCGDPEESWEECSAQGPPRPHSDGILVHSLVNICVCLWPFSGGPVAHKGSSASASIVGLSLGKAFSAFSLGLFPASSSNLNLPVSINLHFVV